MDRGFAPAELSSELDQTQLGGVTGETGEHLTNSFDASNVGC